MPLSVKDGMGAWIKDFQKSDAPQFKGKSDKERREMAMAAYLSAKRGNKNEATDNPPFTPDPPKPKAKNSDGSTTSPMSRARQLARQARDRSKEKDEGYVSHAQRKAVWANRADGGKGHPDKKVKESVELDEAKDMYKSAAGELKDYANKNGGMDKKDFHTAAKHIENIGRANLMSKGQHLAQLSKHLRNLDTSPREKVLSVLNKHGHNVGDFMPGAKMRRESVDEAGSPERLAMIRKAGEKINKEKKKAERDAKRAMSKDKDMMGEAKLDELSPATHKSYQAKAFTSGAAGMAAKRMGTMSAKDAYDNEKKRHAGIELSKSLQRRDDRKKRNEETVSELKKSTLGSYVNKASRDAASKAYGAASAAKDNRADQSGKDFAKSLKRLRGIDTATKKLANESTLLDIDHTDPDFKGLLKKHNVKHKVIRTHDTGYSDIKLHGHPDAIKKVKKTMNYEESVEEAKSFDQKFKDHLKFATSKSKAVQDYMKKRVADRDAMNKKNDPNAAKKGYALSATPPERAYMKARKKGMSTGQARDAMSQYAARKKNMSGKLPEGKIEEAVQFKVDVEGLPPTFMNGKSVGEILANLRKIVKQPSMIKSVDRVTKMDVKTAYRKKAQGRDIDEASVIPSKDGKSLVPMKKRPEPKDKPVPNSQFGLPRLKKLGEISKSLAKNYFDKATAPGATKPASDLGHTKDSMRKTHNRVVGSNRAIDRMVGKRKTNEDNVNEISKDLRDRYKEKAKSDQAHQQFSADIAKEMGAKDSEKYYRKKQRNRTAGLAMVKRRENG